MSIVSGILRGALQQGLSDISKTNEFYGDLIKNAALNLGAATDNALSQFPEDVRQSEKIFSRYQTLVEAIGKDKADYIYNAQPDLLDKDNYLEMAKLAVFKPNAVNEAGESIFKYTGGTEPIDVMNKNMMSNVNAVKDRLNASSSMKGMSKYTDFYLDELDALITGENVLQPTDAMVVPEGTPVMTAEERSKAAEGVILPSEFMTPNMTTARNISIIQNFGEEEAKKMLSSEDFSSAKAALIKVSPIEQLWMASPRYKSISMRLANLTPGTDDYFSAEAQLKEEKDIFMNAYTAAGMDNKQKAEKLSGTIDKNKKFYFNGEEIKWKKLIPMLQGQFEQENVSEEEIIFWLLDNGLFHTVPE